MIADSLWKAFLIRKFDFRGFIKLNNQGELKMFFTLPKPLPDSDRVFSWIVVGAFSTWGGVVRYLMENKSSGRIFSRHEALSQVVISGFTGFLAGLYGYEQGYSEFMVMVFSGLCGVFGSHLLDLLWKRVSRLLGNENHSKH